MAATRAVVDSKTGRVIRGGWKSGIGVVRPGENVRDAQARAHAGAMADWQAEDARKRDELAANIDLTRRMLAGEFGPLTPPMEATAKSAIELWERELGRPPAS